MIKFFRKIRQKLLAENRFSKYLIYAIGEIILVVIGIMIALYINNQNEARKSKDKVEAIFADIMDELTTDIEKVTGLMQYYAARDSTMLLILTNKLTKEDYVKNEIPYLFTLTNNYTTANLTREAFNNLMLYRDEVPEEYSEIIKDLNSLYNKTQVVVNDYDNELKSFISETQKFRMQNYPWFVITTETDINNVIEYRLNDFKYKNELQNYRTLAIYNQLKFCTYFRQNAIDCYQKIADKLNKPRDHELFKFNEQLAKDLVGDWYLENDPDFTLSINLEDDRLYAVTYDGRKVEFFYIPRVNKILDSDMEFSTIVRDEDQTIIKYNSYNVIKKQP